MDPQTMKPPPCHFPPTVSLSQTDGYKILATTASSSAVASLIAPVAESHVGPANLQRLVYPCHAAFHGGSQDEGLKSIKRN